MNACAFWTRVYRVSLRALPIALREKHGSAMELMFVRELERSRASGGQSTTGAAITAIWDAMTRGAYEQWRGMMHGVPLAETGMPLFAHVPEPRVLVTRLAKRFAVNFGILTLGLVVVSAWNQFQPGRHSASQLWDIAVLSVPFTAVLTAPMAVFMAVASVMLELRKSAMASSAAVHRGKSRSPMVPVLAFAAAIGLGTFVLAAEVVPRSNTRLISVLYGQAATLSDRAMTLRELEARGRDLQGQLAVRQASIEREKALTGAQRSIPYEAEMLVDRLAYMDTEVRDARLLMASNAVEIHKKYALAAACVFFALAALALAPRDSRFGKTRLVVSSLGLLVMYYMCLIAGEKLADDLVISPRLAMWGANDLVFLGALMLLWYRMRSGGTQEQFTEVV